MIVEFCIGDPSQDGHNQTETFFIETNRANLFFKANRGAGVGTKKLNKKLGFDIETLCHEYEDNTIRGAKLAKLIELNLLSVEQQQDWIEDDEETGEPVLVDMDAQNVLTIWLDGLKLVDPDFEYKYVKPAHDNRITSHIAYGCFC